MLCSISGHVPVEPVVSTKSGHVFEKRLVLEYLSQNQSKCPVTSELLDAERDLLPLQLTNSTNSTNSANSANANKPTTTTFSPEAASIPQILALFQNEWDAVMLETFTLKKHLEKTRGELSHALYQHDAACRVIARLSAENDALRAKLAAKSSNSDENDVEMDAGLSAEAVATIDATQKALAKQRKDFKKAEGPKRAALLAKIGQWNASASHNLHDADKPGVLCVAVDPRACGRIATGGVDKKVQLFDTQRAQLVATLRGHGKKVSHVALHATADVVVSASYDKTVKVWTPVADEEYTAAHTLVGHEDAVTGVSLHATGDYVASASLDGSWGLFDLRRGQLLGRSYLSEDPTKKEATNCVAFHPDGGILGTGSSGRRVQMWDVKSLANVVTFDGHAAAVNSLAFSENGYQLATGSHDGVVKLWDLRKLKSVAEVAVKGGGPIHSVAFDASGSYLAVAAASSVHVLKEAGKTEWELVTSWTDHKAAVTSVAFAPDSSFLASASMDRSTKLYR